MQKIFNANPKELLDIVRELTDERFASVEHVLAARAELARLTIDISKETKQRNGRIFKVTGNLIIGAEHYTASTSAETLEQAIDEVRDEILRLLRSSRGKSIRMLRKGGAKIKSLLRFGRASE
ncbi:MAG TPA: hypothetical protein ENI56_02780 [Candidatus Kaiserbacteria bacterium]|nr:hypothetical protein [Candidatus Kaiserbacteria bacterium]